MCVLTSDNMEQCVCDAGYGLQGANCVGKEN